MSRTDFEAAYIERYGHRPRGWNDDFQVYQDAHANGAWFGWQAREVVMPDVSAMARILSDRAADACNIDRADNWAMYGQEYIDDVQAMLAAAPSAPATVVSGETVQGDTLTGEYHADVNSLMSVNQQLLEALESLILHANPALFSPGQLEQSKRAIAAARKEGGK